MTMTIPGTQAPTLQAQLEAALSQFPRSRQIFARCFFICQVLLSYLPGVPFKPFLTRISFKIPKKNLMTNSHQLRLDFETMSGFVTASKGTCTDYLTAKGFFLNTFFNVFTFIQSSPVLLIAFEQSKQFRTYQDRSGVISGLSEGYQRVIRG